MSQDDDGSKRGSAGFERAAAVHMRQEFRSCQMHSIILCFQDPGTEAKYLAEVAAWRWPVLLIIFAFDILVWAIRAGWEVLFTAAHATCDPSDSMCLKEDPVEPLLSMSASQVTNLCVLHGLLWTMNFRSRRTGEAAARQEECLLAVLIALAVSNLIFCLTAENGSDYIYAVFFLICSASYVKVRWWLAMGAMILPTCTSMFKSHRVLPPSSKQHMVVAWLAGALMSWLAESYRRCTFANQQAARLAHTKELEEKSRHLSAQEELATAREEAAQRASVVMREKAANEAKSEFMSLMCHEVRTPLNGCLASAEMLLDTPLLDEQRELTNTIRISGSILLSTVSNFLDFFKVLAGKKLDIVRTPFYLTDLVTDTHAIVDAMMGQNKKVQLLPPQSEMAVACLMGDPDRLKGVLLNLFSNAAKFTPSGFICVRLRKCMAQEVASETHINPERSYTMCLQALQKVNQNDEYMDMSQCMESVASGGSHAFVISAPHRGRRSVSKSGQKGPALTTWWEEWLEDGKEPDWDSWKACTLPRRSRSELASNDSDAEDAHLKLTQIRGAARTTRSDPGRRKKQNINRRDGRAANGMQVSANPESRPSCTSRASEGDSQASAAGPGTSGSASKEVGTNNGLCGVAAAAAQDQNDNADRQQQSARTPGVAKQPNSRSALDLPGQVIVVEVVDTGVGVPEEARKRLFSKFVQGSENEMEKARAVSGTGLGLSICAKQMNVLGGTIGASSSPSRGSIFWFCFPVEEAPAAEDEQTLPHSSSWHPSPACSSPCAQPLSISHPNLPTVVGGSSQTGSGSGSSTVAVGSMAAAGTSITLPSPSSGYHQGTGSASMNVTSHPGPTTCPSSGTNLSSSFVASNNSPVTRSSTALRSSTSTQHTGVSIGSFSSHHENNRASRHAFAHAQMIPDDLGRASPTFGQYADNQFHNSLLYNSSVTPSYTHVFHHRQSHPLKVLQEDRSTAGSASLAPHSRTSSPKIPEASPGSLDGVFIQQEGVQIQPPRDGATAPDGGSHRPVRAPPGTAPLFLSLASDSLLYKPPRATSSSGKRSHSVNGARATSGDSNNSREYSLLRNAISLGGTSTVPLPQPRHTVNACDSSSLPQEPQHSVPAQQEHPIPRSASRVTLPKAMPQHENSSPLGDKQQSTAPHFCSTHSSCAAMYDSDSTSSRSMGMPKLPVPGGVYGVPPDPYSVQMWAAHAAMMYYMMPPTAPMPMAAALPVYSRFPAAPIQGDVPPMMQPWPHVGSGMVPADMTALAGAAHTPGGVSPQTVDAGGATFAADAATAAAIAGGAAAPLSGAGYGVDGQWATMSPSASASMTLPPSQSPPTVPGFPNAHAYSPGAPHLFYWNALQQLQAATYTNPAAVHSHPHAPHAMAGYPSHPGYVAHSTHSPAHANIPHPSSHLGSATQAHQPHFHPAQHAHHVTRKAASPDHAQVPNGAVGAHMHVDASSHSSAEHSSTGDAVPHIEQRQGTDPMHAQHASAPTSAAPSTNDASMREAHASTSDEAHPDLQIAMQQQPPVGDMASGVVATGGMPPQSTRHPRCSQQFGHRAAAATSTPTARRSCDRSVPDSQGDSLPGSSLCESLDTWAAPGGGASASVRPWSRHSSLDESHAYMHAAGAMTMAHRGSLDRYVSASAPHHNSLSLREGHRSVPSSMHQGAGSTDDGDQLAQEHLPPSPPAHQSTPATNYPAVDTHEHGNLPSMSIHAYLMQDNRAGPGLAPAEMAPARQTELSLRHLHAHTHEKRQCSMPGLAPTRLADVPEGQNECALSDRPHSLDLSSDNLLAYMSSPGANAPQVQPCNAAALQEPAQHVGGSRAVSRGSSVAGSTEFLCAQQASSFDVTSGMCVHHNGSEGGSRSWASQRSFGEEEVGSGGGDFGIDGVRVLVAEDNLINQMVAKKMLTALGATVSVVSNGQEAVNSVCADLGPKSDDTTFDASQTDSSQNRETDSESNGYAFDVVLMDMAMPQMDGLQATLELRRRGCKVPIVAMTANVSDRDRATCHDSGMDGFLSKPILKGRLGRAIRQVIASGTLFPPSMIAEQAARRALEQGECAPEDNSSESGGM